MGDELSSAQRQLVEIMRAVKSAMRVLALDEPTSSLTDEEVDRLFALVRRLRAEGVADHLRQPPAATRSCAWPTGWPSCATASW